MKGTVLKKDYYSGGSVITERSGAGVAGASRADGASGLADGGAGVSKSVSEELELLERVDLLESSLARLRSTLWAAAPRRGPRRRDDGAIVQKIQQRAEFLVFHTGWLNRW